LAWTRNFKSIEQARFALRAWIHDYNTNGLTWLSTSKPQTNTTKHNAKQPE
jgi:hypothetical protein